MSAKPPILILQMQRMGDLILSFPLAVWLLHRFPGHPVWLVGEEGFFKGLLPIAPTITFFPVQAMHRLHGGNFHLVLNLSHRPEAARLRRHINCDAWLGPYADANDEMHIAGDWQLYRASLTHNNRHNLFHWSDLNALDIIPYQQWSGTGWQQPQPALSRGDRIGLFLGASEADKRPEADFWAKLTRHLLKLGLRPVLLGGKHERSLGTEVARLTKTPALNLCGRFDLPGLVSFMNNLSLLVTPDTGPMHLGAWLGLPVLNLSLGPVNAWETGPYQPGHVVVRSTISCAGCWQCTRPSVWCRESFSASRVASLIRTILDHKAHDPELSVKGKPPSLGKLGRLALPGQEIFITGRYKGLYNLAAPNPPGAANGEPGQSRSRLLLDRFWQAYFAHNLGLWDQTALKTAAADIQNHIPQLAAPFARALDRLRQDLLNGLKARPAPLDSDFWKNSMPLLRPLTGYLHLQLQNSNYSASSFAAALELSESLRELLR